VARLVLSSFRAHHAPHLLGLRFIRAVPLPHSPGQDWAVEKRRHSIFRPGSVSSVQNFASPWSRRREALFAAGSRRNRTGFSLCVSRLRGSSILLIPTEMNH